MLFISHNLGVIAKMCARVGVLYAGRVVEEGPVEEVLREPKHPYTVGLLRCIPRGGVRKDHGRLDTIPGFLPNLGEELPGCVFAAGVRSCRDLRHEEPPLYEVGAEHRSRCHFHEQAQSLPRELAAELDLPPVDHAEAPLLRFDDLGKVFRQQGQEIHALTGVSAAVWPGETLGLVGESGSGKTTLARTLLGIVAPTSGAVSLGGRELAPRLERRSKDEIRTCRSSSRIPIRRSTAGTPSAGSSSAPFASLRVSLAPSPSSGCSSSCNPCGSRALRQCEAGPALGRAEAAARHRARVRR